MKYWDAEEWIFSIVCTLLTGVVVFAVAMMIIEHNKEPERLWPDYELLKSADLDFINPASKGAKYEVHGEITHISLRAFDNEYAIFLKVFAESNGNFHSIAIHTEPKYKNFVASLNLGQEISLLVKRDDIEDVLFHLIDYQ